MPIDRTVPDVHLHTGGERCTTGGGGVHQRVFPADVGLEAGLEGLLEFVPTKAVAIA